MPKRKKRTALKIAEISGVDVPAQEGARALIMKRRTAPEGQAKKDLGPEEKLEELAKGALMTTAVNGHSHLIFDCNFDGSDMNSGTTSFDDGHFHRWMRMPDGSIVIGETEEHTHDVALVSKRTFTAEECGELAEQSRALPDGSFPIVNREDLLNAIRAFGRAKDKTKVASHIKARARALKLTDLLPEEGALAEMMKSAGDVTQAAGEAGTTVGKEINMTDKPQKAAPTVEDLQKQLDRANKVAELTDAQKAYFKSLDGAAQDAFLAKSADDRQAEIDAVEKAARDADPVVYTTRDGIELRKSAGEALIAMAKSNDALREQNEALAKANADAEIRKRAETELKYLPGDVETRMALIKSVEGIEDDAQREAAMNALKAQNEALSKAFDTVGHGGQAPANSATDQLDALAKKYQEDNPGTSFAKAYDAVLQTEKGQELYAQSLN